MKVLLDSCVWGRAAAEIRSAGHDTIWAGDWPSDPGDDEILARALEEKRILVTLDKDFGELAIVFGKPHCGIIRLVNFGSKQQAMACLQVLMTNGAELEAGAIVTAKPGQVRIRPAE